MHIRNWKLILVIPVIAAVCAVAYLATRPGPESPKWWVKQALIHASDIDPAGMQSELLFSAVEVQVELGDVPAASATSELLRWPPVKAKQAPGILSRLQESSQRRAAWQKARYALARALAARGDEAGAMAALGRPIEVGASSDLDSVLVPLVEWYVRNNDFQSAERIALSFGSVHCLSTVETVAVAKAKGGNVEGALALLEKTRGKMPSNSSALVKAKVDVLLAAGKYDDAMELAKAASNRHDLLLVIAKAQALDGNIQQAIATLSAIHDQLVHEGSVAEIIAQLARAGKVDQALELEGKVSDRFCRSYVEACIVEAMAAKGELQQAESRFSRIAEPLFADNAAKALAKVHLESGNADSARRYLEVLIPSTQLDLFLELARNRLAAGDSKRFTEYMEDARKTADSKEVHRRNALLSIMLLCAEAGDFARAKTALDDITADYSFVVRGTTLREMGRDKGYAMGKVRLRELRALARAYASSPERRLSLLEEIRKLATAEERCAAYLGGAASFAKPEPRVAAATPAPTGLAPVEK